MINIQEKKEHYYPILEESGWDIVLEYVKSPMFDNLLVKLIKQVEQGNRFTPKYKDVFNAFIKCPYDKLKVVFIGQDPYPQLGVADGIAFSCSKTNKEQPSLKFVFNEVQSQYPEASRNPDLSRWSNQGVLMLNVALTVQIGKIGSHYGIWSDFTNHVLTELAKKTDLVVVLLGKKAEEYQLLFKNANVIKVSHPASAAYRNGVWNSNLLFKTINNILSEQGKELIRW